MEYTKWIKLKQSKMLCYTPYKVPVPLCGGTTAVVQLYCCPFQCMRPIPKNKAYQGQALFAGVKRLCLGNGAAHGVQLPAVDFRQLAQGSVSDRVRRCAGTVGHTAQIRTDAGFTQGGFLRTKGRVAADNIFYISPPAIMRSAHRHHPFRGLCRAT